MRQNVSPLFASGIAWAAFLLVIAAMIPSCAPATHRVSGDPEDPGQGTNDPASFARLGLSLLTGDSSNSLDTRSHTAKGDALIMRAWDLQQTHPESCESVWQLTKTFVDQQIGPRQKIALTNLYLESVESAVESAVTTKAFDDAWEVRQAVQSEIAKHWQDLMVDIENELVVAVEGLGSPDAIQKFIEEDAERWRKVRSELNAGIESQQRLPEAVGNLVFRLRGTLQEFFDQKTKSLRDRLNTSTESDLGVGDGRVSATAESPSTSPVSDEVGVFTQLLGESDSLLRMRDSPSMSSWIDLASRLTALEDRQVLESLEAQVRELEALRASIHEARTLQYNVWASNAIYNASRRGADGLFMLGEIETRLLVGVVATAYSITEGRLIGEIQDPANRQAKIRGMLSQIKKQLVEF
jgi:hypothetical protein